MQNFTKLHTNFQFNNEDIGKPILLFDKAGKIIGFAYITHTSRISLGYGTHFINENVKNIKGIYGWQFCPIYEPRYTVKFFEVADVLEAFGDLSKDHLKNLIIDKVLFSKNITGLSINNGRYITRSDILTKGVEDICSQLS